MPNPKAAAACSAASKPAASSCSKACEVGKGGEGGDAAPKGFVEGAAAGCATGAAAPPGTAAGAPIGVAAVGDEASGGAGGGRGGFFENMEMSSASDGSLKGAPPVSSASSGNGFTSISVGGACTPAGRTWAPTPGLMLAPTASRGKVLEAVRAAGGGVAVKAGSPTGGNNVMGMYSTCNHNPYFGIVKTFHATGAPTTASHTRLHCLSFLLRPPWRECSSAACQSRPRKGLRRCRRGRRQRGGGGGRGVGGGLRIRERVFRKPHWRQPPRARQALVHLCFDPRTSCRHAFSRRASSPRWAAARCR